VPWQGDYLEDMTMRNMVKKKSLPW
jgi:hypothetical protein